MPRLSIGDAELYYEEHGDGPPLLLVAGLSGLGSFWSHQVGDLARDFRVIVHDHRGTGQSTPSRIRYSVDQMTEDVRRLMDGLGLDAAHVAGHSTGGAIGQTLAQDDPSRVRSLVLSATWAGPDAFFRRAFAVRKEILLRLGPAWYQQLSSLFLYPPGWISANDAALTTQEAAAAAHPTPDDILASRMDAIVRFDRRARLGEIRAPTLVIVADDDMITPRFYSEELAAGIPGARLVVLPDGGHFVPRVHPEAYTRAVGDFLRAQLARPAPAAR